MAKRADVTITLPLPDDATEEDAHALGQFIEARLTAEGPLSMDATVVRTELVDGSKLGYAGARNLLDQLDDERR